MKKKIILGLLTIVMCFVLVGCGKENTETNNNGNDVVEDTQTNSDADEIELYSDNTKMVFQRGNAKLVFYYSGDKITKYESYLDYENAAAAQYALSVYEKDEDVKNIYLKGRYLVVEYNESAFENMTTSQVRALYSYLEEAQKNK